MHVGVCKITLQLRENGSLKGKRRVVSSLRSRLRNKFNVSVAEVEANEMWQTATLGISCVSNSARHVDEILGNVTAYLEASRDDIVLVGQEQETLSGF